MSEKVTVVLRGKSFTERSNPLKDFNKYRDFLGVFDPMPPESGFRIKVTFDDDVISWDRFFKVINAYYGWSIESVERDNV